jgi:hypothetical protein
MAGDKRRAIKAAIATAIARAPEADIEWVRRHFIYHKTHSYLVIPNLYSCDSEQEGAKALAMNQLAGVLDDLNLVEWPKPGWFKLTKSELQKLKDEEAQSSDTDLTKIRQEWLDKHGKTSGPDAETRDAAVRDAAPLRNHGLFSKAEKALTIAGWSEAARRDIEVYRLVDVEGLTPILDVLNDWGDGPSQEKAEQTA